MKLISLCIFPESIDLFPCSSYGSLFPALHRMEEKGWVSAEWKTSDKNRRAKYYRITKAGLKQLRAEEEDWTRVVKAVTMALRSS